MFPEGNSSLHARFSSRVGLVVIGRNEGDRLRRCLVSLGEELSVVYVDSGSTDESVTFARSVGVEVVELDSLQPFTASRARNVGFTRLLEILPTVELVQFVDGDCEIADGWISAAREYFATAPDAAVVCGRLQEKSPQASIYNRLGDHEWKRPTGVIESCGGIFMIRRSVFERVGGFDPLIAAGEEPNLCCRIRALDLQVVRIDHAMAVHDLNMFRFTQWWRRSIRGGYGALNLTLFGPVVSRAVFRRQVISVLIWGVLLPFLVLAGTAGAMVAGNANLSIVIPVLGIAAVFAQVLKISIRNMRAGTPVADAFAFGAFTILWKSAAVFGFLKCLLDRLRSTLHSKPRVAVRPFHKSD